MDNETTTKNLVAAVAERDRRIAELAQSLIDAAGKIDAAEARCAMLKQALDTENAAFRSAVAAAVAARVVAIRARVEAVDRWDDVEESMNSMVRARDGVWVNRDDVLSAIDATEGGAP